MNVVDELRDKRFPVLDDGFVCLLDWMGDDSIVCQAARVTTGSTVRRPHNDRNLIRYLMRHSELGPFEQCEIKLMIRLPMDVWRQLGRYKGEEHDDGIRG
jgi:thymidylate synthase (FAD)